MEPKQEHPARSQPVWRRRLLFGLKVLINALASMTVLTIALAYGYHAGWLG